MKVGLFVPCYVDAFFPEVGVATLEILERCGVEVSYPLEQTCCGQPMANSGCQDDAAPAEALFVENFKAFDYIVAPSGSCTHHVRAHFDAIPQSAEVTKVRDNIYALVEFLHDVVKVGEFPLIPPSYAVSRHRSPASLLRQAHCKAIAIAARLPARSA
jgi:L-lactate dehydrogenase complex protein LldE